MVIYMYLVASLCVWTLERMTQDNGLNGSEKSPTFNSSKHTKCHTPPFFQINKIYILHTHTKYLECLLYNTLALPVLLYGSETWTIEARDARRITAAETKYTRRTAGYI